MMENIILLEGQLSDVKDALEALKSEELVNPNLQDIPHLLSRVTDLCNEVDTLVPYAEEAITFIENIED